MCVEGKDQNETISDETAQKICSNNNFNNLNNFHTIFKLLNIYYYQDRFNP